METVTKGKTAHHGSATLAEKNTITTKDFFFGGVFLSGKICERLPPGGRGTAIAVEGACVTIEVFDGFILTHSPSVTFGDSSLSEGAFCTLFRR